MQTGNLNSLYRQARASLFSQNHWFIYMSIISGLFLGLSIIKWGPLPSMGILVGLIGILVAFRYPELVILVMLGYAFRLIPTQFNYSVQVAGRHFFLIDFLFLSLIAIIFIRPLMDKSFRLVKTPLDVPLLIFAVAVVIGAATATLKHDVNFSDTTPEARILLLYLIFFPVTNLIRSERQLNRLIKGFLLMGILIALMMLAQFMVGPSISLIDKSDLWGSGEVIRFYNPGTTAVYLTFMVLLCGVAIQSDDHRRYLRYLLIIVLSLALLLTLGRNLVFSTAISLGVLVILLGKRHLSRLVVSPILIAAIASGILVTFQLLGMGGDFLRYLTSYVDRISHLFTAGVLSPEETGVWRWKEILYAWPKLMDNPILGVGLYTPYRPPFYVGENLIRFIHNAYLFLWLKTGLLGLIAFLGLSYRFLSRGFRFWRSSSNTLFCMTILGLTLMYLAMIISNLVAPTLVESLCTAAFGVMMGINEVIYSFQAAEKTSMKGAFHYG